MNFLSIYISNDAAPHSVRKRRKIGDGAEKTRPEKEKNKPSIDDHECRNRGLARPLIVLGRRVDLTGRRERQRCVLLRRERPGAGKIKGEKEGEEEEVRSRFCSFSLFHNLDLLDKKNNNSPASSSASARPRPRPRPSSTGPSTPSSGPSSTRRAVRTLRLRTATPPLPAMSSRRCSGRTTSCSRAASPCPAGCARAWRSSARERAGRAGRGRSPEEGREAAAAAAAKEDPLWRSEAPSSATRPVGRRKTKKRKAVRVPLPSPPSPPPCASSSSPSAAYRTARGGGPKCGSSSSNRFSSRLLLRAPPLPRTSRATAPPTSSRSRRPGGGGRSRRCSPTLWRETSRTRRPARRTSGCSTSAGSLWKGRRGRRGRSRSCC